MVTRILIDPETDLPDGTLTPAPIRLDATLLGVRSDGALFVSPTRLGFTVNTAADIVQLAAPTATTAWRLTIRRLTTLADRFGSTALIPGPVVQERTVHFAETPAGITWADLTDVDPATLAAPPASTLLDVGLDELRAQILGDASAAFDTLKEVETALGDDPNLAATLTALIGQKATPADITAAIQAKAASDVTTFVSFGTTAPSNPALSPVWVDTSVTPQIVKGWNGSAWVAIGGAGGSGAAIVDNGDGTLSAPSGTVVDNGDGTFTFTTASGTLIYTKAQVDTLIAGAGSGNALLKASNLSDLASASTARTNLGLGSAATHPSTDFDSTGAASAAQAYAVQRANHTGTQSADTLTDGTTNKAYTATEKTKLAGVATGATANATDAQLRDRSTHTGTQAASTITGLAAVATSGKYTDLSGIPSTSWLPTGAFAETCSRFQRVTAIPITSGRLSLNGGIVVPAGKTVTSITFVTANGAAASLTNQWFCLVDQNLNVLAKTADDGTTAWAASTPKTLALTTPWTPSVATPVYLGLVIVASTMPTMEGVEAASAGSGAAGLAPFTSGNSTASLTGPSTLGATAAAVSYSNALYGYLS